MRIEQHLDKRTIAKLRSEFKSNSFSHANGKTSNRRTTERLSERDVKELMGTNRQTYKRVGGRVRNK